MRHMRAWSAGVLTALSLAFLALLTRAAYEALEMGSVSQATLAMLFVTGFLIVTGAVVLGSQGKIAQIAARHCTVCGSPLYATVRSLDRRRLLTCFTCGHETVAA